MITLRIALVAAATVVLVLVLLRIWIWQTRPSTRPCKWFGHDKKYVALRTCGCVAANSPNASGRGFNCDHNHQIGDQGIYIARWVCTRCPEMAEECLGRTKDWMIEHGKLVPNVKKWANWSQDPPPINNDAARAALKAVEERLEAQNAATVVPPPVTVKVDIQNDKFCKHHNRELCKTCGWCHSGPCNPNPPAHYCDRCKAEHTGSCPAL